MYKKAGYKGNIVADSSPSGVEKYLIQKIESAIGNDLEGVKINPLLQIDEYTDDMSGDVKDGYGAVAITVADKTLHIPFIMKDKQFLPFDSIRMGEAQVAYEEDKLKKLVDVIRSGGGAKANGEDEFEIMSLGDIKDLPFDNGFLGTIMSIRDNAKRSASNYGNRFRGIHNGDFPDERVLERMAHTQDLDMEKVASDAIANSFHEMHEKLAAVQRFTEDDILKVAEDIRQKAIREYDEEVLKSSERKIPEDKTQSLLRRQSEEIKMVSFRVAGSQKTVEFPHVDGKSSTRSSGLIFRDIRRFGSDSDSSKKGYNALMVDKNGNFKLIHDTEEVLIYPDRRLSDIKMRFATASTFKKDKHHFYSMYTDKFFQDGSKETILLPFKITDDYKSSREENGRIKSFTELTSDGGTYFNSSQSTLIQNVCVAQEILDDYANLKTNFLVVIARIGDRQLSTGVKTVKDVIKEIMDKAAHERDLNVSISMLRHFGDGPEDKVIVLQPNTPVINFKGFGIPTISKREELLGMSKRASYDDQNKVRLYINERNNPVTYNISIMYTQAEDTDGLSTTSLQTNNINHLSEVGARRVLNDIGYSHREVDDFFRSAQRSGRYAEYPAANIELSKNYKYVEPTDEKVKKAINGMVTNTMNANRYIPVMENVIADSISGIAKTILDAKLASSHEVAMMMEKRANETRDPFDADVAMLVHQKYLLDKLACDINEGYLTGTEDVFESLLKVAHYIPSYAEELYYKQFRGKDELYKQAMLELDGLTQHAIIGNEFYKEASIKKRMNTIKGAMGKAKDKLTPQVKKNVKQSQNELNSIKKEIGDLKNRRDRLAPYMSKQPKQVKEVHRIENELDGLYKKRTDATVKLKEAQLASEKFNRVGMGAVGLPALGYGSYALNKE